MTKSTSRYPDTAEQSLWIVQAQQGDQLVECYQSTQELIELCPLRGVDLKKYPETSLFRLPTWLFIFLFRWLWTYNESMQRFTARGADSL